MSERELFLHTGEIKRFEPLIRKSLLKFSQMELIAWDISDLENTKFLDIITSLSNPNVHYCDFFLKSIYLSVSTYLLFFKILIIPTRQPWILNMKTLLPVFSTFWTWFIEVFLILMYNLENEQKCPANFSSRKKSERCDLLHSSY